MSIKEISNRFKYYILFGVFLICFIYLVSIDRIPQDLAYHNFADQNKFWSIPNFWDVMSNLPMFFIGLFGLYYSLKHWSQKISLLSNLMPLFLSLGIFGASFGSAYYHWAPDNQTLVWDRLPMTFMFMPFFAMIIYESIGEKLGEWAFCVLVPLGVFSIFYWQYTESLGAGDLRIYAFVQFFPMLFVPFMLYLFPISSTHLKLVLLVLFWYVLAKLAEHFDLVIFETLGFWSGHTIKHLLGAIALIFVIRYLMSWQNARLNS